MAEESTPKRKSQKRKRSPAYPSYSLKACVQFIERLYKKDGLAEIPKEFALQHMGLDPRKNDAYRATSSITGFGLLEEVGLIDKRSFKWTELGKTLVILKEGTDRKIVALQEAALNYDIIKQLRSKWPSGLPAVDVLKLELVNRGFTERAAYLFASVLRETYEFAKLEHRGILSEYKSSEEPADYRGTEEESEDMGMPLKDFKGYTLTLAKGKEVKLFTSDNLTQEDIDFMMQWIKRLDLMELKASEQLSPAEQQKTNEQENDDKEPDIPF